MCNNHFTQAKRVSLLADPSEVLFLDSSILTVFEEYVKIYPHSVHVFLLDCVFLSQTEPLAYHIF